MAVHYATCLGFAYDSPTVEFPVRTGPGTTFDLAPFKITKGTTNLEVLDVQPDVQNTTSDLGRVYNWFKLKFPNGQIGWMRGHVIGIVGDFTAYGYGVLNELKHEYTLTRGPVPVTTSAAATPAAQPAPASATPQAVETAKTQQETQKELAKAAAAQQTAAPAQPAAPQPAAQPAPTLQGTWQPIRPTTPAIARIKLQSAAKIRNMPTTSGSSVLVTIPRDSTVKIVQVGPDSGGMYHRWFKVEANGQVGWVREDLVSVEGDGEALGLPWDLYPAPLANRWWVRGWNMPPQLDPNAMGGQHDGWDFGAATGEPILAGPAGGLVVKTVDCVKCTPDRPNTPAHGLGLGNPAVFQDPGWGFGYGTYVIVGYSHDKLPNSTKAVLAQRGYPGGSIFVMYAHLQRRMVNEGQQLAPNQQIGTCGNTGNSEATHLHLEIRASASDRFTGWAEIRRGVMDPVVLFHR